MREKNKPTPYSRGKQGWKGQCSFFRLRSSREGEKKWVMNDCKRAKEGRGMDAPEEKEGSY